MAILTINEFVERVNFTIVHCENCKGCMDEIEINKLDALKLIFGKRTFLRRYKCRDCMHETLLQQKANL